MTSTPATLDYFSLFPTSPQQPQTGLIVTGIALHGQGTQNTVLRDSQGAPPPALLFLRSSHSETESSASVQHLFVSTHNQLVL